MFDDDDDATGNYNINEQFKGLLKGMMYADNGWLTKKLFVVNRDNSASGRAATFNYKFTSAIFLKSVKVVLIGLISVISFNWIIYDQNPIRNSIGKNQK